MVGIYGGLTRGVKIGTISIASRGYELRRK
jgi:hypothetical protein